MMPANEHRIWFKEPYVWMIIGFPAAAIVAGIITVILAIQSEDGLVVDDYYKRGLEINRTLDRDRIAQSHNLDARIHYPGPGNQMMIEISSSDNYELPSELRFNLLHSTRKGFDQIFMAQRDNNNQYFLPVLNLNKGRWHILIETDDWRIVKQIRVN